MNQLTAYKKSLKMAWGYNDYNDWPIKFNAIMHLFLDEFALEFITDLQKALQSYEREEISESFNNPARIYRIIHSVIYGMKANKFSIEEQQKVAEIMLKMVSDLKSGSPFNENGRNIILDDMDEFHKCDFYVSDEAQATKLQRFFGLMWAYTESLFFRAHDVTKEIHGLYRDGTERVLIREYYNLKPNEIWTDMKFMDYSNLKFITYYSDELDVSLDAYNHIYFNRGNYIKDMQKYRIEADGKQITLDELMNQIPKIETCINLIHEWAKQSSQIDKINRYADIYWYRKKPLKDLLNQNWEVPQKVRDRIENGAIDKRRITRMSDRQIDFIINTLL